MATFTIVVREKNERRDGKILVAIRMTHRGKQLLIPTDVYVVRKQINSDFSGLNDKTINRILLGDIFKYERILLDNFGANLSLYSAKELLDYLKAHNASTGGAAIDFIAFFK